MSDAQRTGGPVTISSTYLGLAGRDGQLNAILRVVTIGLLLLVPVVLAIASGFRRPELFFAAGLGAVVIGIAVLGIWLRLRLVSTLWQRGVVVRATLQYVSEETNDEGGDFLQAHYPFRVGDRTGEFIASRAFLTRFLRDFPTQVTLLVDPQHPEDRLRLG